MAMRCSVTRPSFRCATRCLMIQILTEAGGRRSEVGLAAGTLFLRAPTSVLPPPPCLFRRLRRRLVELHAEAQAHARQNLLDLVQRLAAEVLRLQHLAFGLL